MKPKPAFRVFAALLALGLVYTGSFPPVMGYLAQGYNHAEEDAVRHKWDGGLKVADRVYFPILWICGKFPWLDRQVYKGVDFFQDILRTENPGGPSA